MASPQVTSIYPADEATGVPIGIDIFITFDSEVDETRARKNIMIFGPDFDTTSGPDSLVWVDPKIGYNPYFLSSPGFNGDLQYDIFFELLNTNNTVYSGLDYGSGSPNYRTRIKITPKKPLAPETTYTVYVLGDDDDSDDITRGITSRTVYSPQLGNNTGDGNIVASGGYSGDSSDQIVIEITEAGDIRTAEYQWYFASNPSLVYTGITSRKYRSLLDTGVDIRFTGENLQVGDTFTINVVPPEYMSASYKYTFTTGTGSIVSIPTSTSTSVIGDLTYSSTSSDTFEVLSTSPENKELKVSPNVRVIKIEFNNSIDPTTINDKTVKVVAHPATGYDPTVADVGRINKFLLVSGRTLYIILETGEE